MRALSPELPTFVGRDRELALLHDRLAAAHGGQGSLVLISGEAGIGKSALADMLCREAADTGAHVLTGHCYDRIETPPYGPWIEITRRIDALPDAANVPHVFRLEGAANQADLFAQVRDFLAALAAQRPLVLVLEDLHWADTASFDLLRFIARGLAEMPVLLVATYRGEELDRRHPLVATVPLLVREAPTERLDLRPLDTADAQALVRARGSLSDDAVARLASHLIERTEGNALFLTELLRSLEEEGLLDRLEGGSYPEAMARTPIPSLLKQIVDARLIRLGDGSAALLAIAAVVGQEVPMAVWESVAHASGEILADAAERAEAAHLVAAWPNGQGIRFTHALVRDALYEDVPALRRRRLHQQVGEALAALPATDPDAVAHHFQRAGDARAVVWLVRAGERAEAAFARRTAAERYETAVEILRAQPAAAEEAGWLQLRAAILRRYEDSDAALAHVERTLATAIESGDARLIAYARIIHGYTLASYGSFGAALRAARTGMGALAALPPPSEEQRAREVPFAAHLHEGPLVVWLAFIGGFAEARARGEQLLGDAAVPPTTHKDAAHDASVWGALAYTYAMQGDVARARHADDAARVAYDLADRHRLVIPPIRAAFAREVLAYVMDQPRERDRIIGDAERTTRRAMGIARPDEGVDFARYMRLPLLVVEGRWQETSDLADRLAAVYKTYSVMYPRRQALGLIARAQGEQSLAWQFVREAFPEGAATEPGAMHFSHALAIQRLAIDLALDGGELETAQRWLEAHDRWLTWSGAMLGRAGASLAWARYYRLAGERARAAASARSALAQAEAPREPLMLLAAHRLLGEIAVEDGQFDAARGHLDAALALADACRAPYERALTLLACAALAVAQGDRTTATDLLDAVRAICTLIDARLALAQAERLAARLTQVGESVGARTVFPAGLTGREVEILRLVAAGLTNGQIAERLYLSPNTVRAHVANIFAKIDVSNRAAATEFALRLGIA